MDTCSPFYRRGYVYVVQRESCLSLHWQRVGSHTGSEQLNCLQITIVTSFNLSFTHLRAAKHLHTMYCEFPPLPPPLKWVVDVLQTLQMSSCITHTKHSYERYTPMHIHFTSTLCESPHMSTACDGTQCVLQAIFKDSTSIQPHWGNKLGGHTYIGTKFISSKGHL